MSTNLGPLLPPSLVEIFSGNNLPSKVGPAAVLVTEGADRFPHPCIVTPGEIVAGDASTMRLALYPESSASRNLRERRVGTLCLADGGFGYYVKAEAEVFATDDPALRHLAVFTLRPRHVLQDGEAGAEVTSGFRFRDLAGDDHCLAGWEPIVAALRATFARS